MARRPDEPMPALSPARGFVVAAPASGSGKTTVTLGLIRALANRGLAVSSFKCGPDYIDPAFHRAASARSCHNLDLWAMRPSTLSRIAGAVADGAGLVVGEGVMGLFDGANGSEGSTADVAVTLGLPVILVVDVRAQAASAAALVHGFASWRDDVTVAGVIFNRVGSDRHRDMLVRASEPLGLPVLGYLGRSEALALPDRHLGLVQAGEHPDLQGFLESAARTIAEALDLGRLTDLARPLSVPAGGGAGIAYLPGQRIAVARDDAFAFAYADLLAGWRAAGAEVLPFSPLADEAPDADADAVYLPGGYPELQAGRLASAATFKAGMRAAAARGATVFGECGGYMVLGEGLVDAEGRRHEMLGLLGLESSFAQRRLHLGYRVAEVVASEGPFPVGRRFRGHEFHYTSVLSESGGEPLFAFTDASGQGLGTAGLCRGRVAGSFLHLIDRC